MYFVCFTVYHLFVSLYYASKISSEHAKLILIWYKRNDLDIQRFKDFFDEINEIQVEEGKYKKYLIRLKISGHFAPMFYKKKILKEIPRNSTLIVFSDEHQATWRLMQLFSRDDSNHIVLVEEGAGTYEMHEFCCSVKERLNRIIIGCIGETNIGMSPLIQSVLVKKPSAFPIQKANDRLVIKQNTMFDDKEWIQSLSVLTNDAVLELKKYNGIKVLWLGQPVNEVCVTIDTEVKSLNKILSCFDNKYSVIIKKHPRDRIEKFDQIDNENTCKYFVNHDTWIPVEVLVGQIEPDIIITPFSSAALNLYELGYGKRVIFCYKLFGLSIDDGWLTPHLENPDIRNASTLEELRQIIDEFEKNPVRNTTEDMTVNENRDIDYLNSLLKEE